MPKWIHIGCTAFDPTNIKTFPIIDNFQPFTSAGGQILLTILKVKKGGSASRDQWVKNSYSLPPSWHSEDCMY